MALFTWDGFIVVPQPTELYSELEGVKQSTLSAELHYQMAVRIGVHKLVVREYGKPGEIYCEQRN